MTMKLIHSDWDETYGDRECSWCSNEYHESGRSEDYLNAHVAYNELRMLDDRTPVTSGGFEDDVVRFTLGLLDDPCRAKIAEATDYELICWCGHSLHYIDCPQDGNCHVDGGTGYCAALYGPSFVTGHARKGAT